MPRRSSKLSDKSSRHDRAYKKAKGAGYAGRAIYKLEEIDKKFRILRRGIRVLDLGCWPGSWMQYAVTKIGDDGYILGIDLRPVEITLPACAETLVGDVNNWQPPTDPPFDVVLSDMAPNTTGDRHSDQFRSEELCRRALAIAQQALRPGGHFVAKVFQGGDFPAILRELRAAFQEGRAYHAKNTRTSSIEQYLIGRGLKSSSTS
ncbi:MAG TPA: RlmE family RNA methyltransferase [Nannocystis exedens]|nr:RlmE family RNA methyltransferase [Nannocystis exedens]